MFTPECCAIAVNAGSETAVETRPVDVKQSCGADVAQFTDTTNRTLPCYHCYNQKYVLSTRNDNKIRLIEAKTKATKAEDR